jgi:hypothetical protein
LRGPALAAASRVIACAVADDWPLTGYDLASVGPAKQESKQARIPQISQKGSISHRLRRKQEIVTNAITLHDENADFLLSA